MSTLHVQNLGACSNSRRVTNNAISRFVLDCARRDEEEQS